MEIEESKKEIKTLVNRIQEISIEEKRLLKIQTEKTSKIVTLRQTIWEFLARLVERLKREGDCQTIKLVDEERYLGLQLILSEDSCEIIVAEITGYHKPKKPYLCVIMIEQFCRDIMMDLREDDELIALGDFLNRAKIIIEPGTREDKDR